MEQRADLHIHTTASDGTLTPEQVVEAASGIGLAAIAITDHDTVSGIAPALEAGRRFGVEVVPGIEISAMRHGRTEAHILGYCIDHECSELVKFVGKLVDARRERAERMVEQLNAAGVPIEFERVVEIARGGALGRPHVAKAICEVSAASSMDSAFGRFLQHGCPGHVPRYKVEPAEAVRLIIRAGGVPCCAHVAKLKRDDLVSSLIEEGLAAVEVWHPDHSAAASRFYERFARARGLIATGGSDAHCFDNGKPSAVGQITVPYEVVERLRRAARDLRPHQLP
ncbi:MAG: hypothetical protein A2Z18_08710 [Armatimonadetes bacterium RBG_16_58_9]|nr:MAG: hypothetical protein A2Z18_08710 [Armatimonadetes bacterium RBG_16_58_9]